MSWFIKSLFLLCLSAIACGESGDETPNPKDTVSGADNDTDTVSEAAPKHPLEAITITQSPAVASVAIVEWLEDLSAVNPSGIEEAYVAYGLGDTLTMKAPVNVTAPGMRTVLLGMKAGALTYSIQSTVVAGGVTYTSAVTPFETGYAPSALTTAEETYRHASLPVEDGFILTGTFGGEATYALIVDAEGDVVWWTKGLADPGQAGSAGSGTSDFTMDWEGKYVYLIATNPDNAESPIRRVSLDGAEVTDFPAGRAHHSLKAVPEGGVVYIRATANAEGEETCDEVAHLDESGTVTTLFNLGEIIPLVGRCHSNFLGYDPALDGFYISSRNFDTAAYITRDLALKWAIGRDEYQTAVTEDFEIGEKGDIVALHGLNVTNGGKNLLLFNNTSTSTSKIYEYSFDDAFDAADIVWSYEREGSGSTELGGVQRLPGGNTQITYSIEGVINQIAPTGEVVFRLDFSSPIGYGNWRKTLYGAPL